MLTTSRLRLRFAVSFTLAFILGLGGLEAFLFFSLHTFDDQRLSSSLESNAQHLARFLQIEIAEEWRSPIVGAIEEGLQEFLPAGDVAAVYDSTGTRIGFQGPSALRQVIPERSLPRASTETRDVPTGRGYDYRMVTVPMVGPVRGAVLILGSTRDLVQKFETLFAWMLATAPIVISASAMAGYFFSYRAVRPMQELGKAISVLPPKDASARLPVTAYGDEIDQLAIQFNGLLDRLRAAEHQNRDFVREAAHQIRTPLTVVLGEAELTLAQSNDGPGYEAALRRVRNAATQMKHRVDELFLLAQAESDYQAPISTDVDLEGLAFEVTDLMRGRAAATGHRLELERVDAENPATGNGMLLREALIELLENACRHASAGSAIAVSAFGDVDEWRLDVRSEGAALPFARAKGDGAGIGLRIVEWIARQHGGRLVVEHSSIGNIIGLRWPVRAT